MMTTIADTTTDALDEVDVASIEPDARQRARLAVKKQIVKAQVLQDQIRDLRRKQAAIDAELDREAERHSAACGPIQLELKEIDNAVVERIVAGAPKDADLDARRQSLLAQLDAQNDGLAEASRRAADQKKALGRQIHELTKEIDNQSTVVLQNRLSSELAAPHLLLEKFTLENRLRWSEARVDAARRQVADIETALKDAKRRRSPREVELYESRLPRWRAELQDAQRELAEACRAADDAFRRRVEE